MGDYYEENSREYFNLTVHVDPTSFLTPLVRVLKPGSTVLDVGCGSGRDLLWLKRRGFIPTGLERSPRLAALARENCGCQILVEDFMTYDFSTHRFDAVILVGALAHLEHTMSRPVLESVCRALSNGGYLYLSLKKGEGCRIDSEGRQFYLWRESQLKGILHSLHLTLVDLSQQFSKIRQDDIWLGCLARKENA